MSPINAKSNVPPLPGSVAHPDSAAASSAAVVPIALPVVFPGALGAQYLRRLLDGLGDLLVAGAAAKVAGRGLPYIFP
jgi:hypothetical protein